MDATAATTEATTMCSSSTSNLHQQSRVAEPYDGATWMAMARKATTTTVMGSTMATTTMATRDTQPTTVMPTAEIDGMSAMTKRRDPMHPSSLNRLLVLVDCWTLMFNKMIEFKNKVSSLMIKQWDWNNNILI
jgi:hypothetical protein